MSTSDHENDIKNVDESNFRKIHEKASKVGYADGVAAGQETIFQQSFDQGYADGLRTGFVVEKFGAFCTTISKSKNEVPHSLGQEAKAYELMNIPHIVKVESAHFYEHKDTALSDISQHQQQILEIRLKDFQEKLPQTSNLFS